MVAFKYQTFAFQLDLNMLFFVLFIVLGVSATLTHHLETEGRPD